MLSGLISAISYAELHNPRTERWRQSLAKVDGVTYHRLSLSDSVLSSVSKITDAACEIIDGAIASNKGRGKILVHCSAGISRSPMGVFDEAEGDDFESSSRTDYPCPAANLTECWVSAAV